MSKQINFNDMKHELTSDDIQQIVSIVTKGCRIKTHNRVESILKYGSRLVGNYGIFNRLIKENNKWVYVAGQSYPDEIRTLRELILEG